MKKFNKLQGRRAIEASRHSITISLRIKQAISFRISAADEQTKRYNSGR